MVQMAGIEVQSAVESQLEPAAVSLGGPERNDGHGAEDAGSP